MKTILIEDCRVYSEELRGKVLHAFVDEFQLPLVYATDVSPPLATFYVDVEITNELKREMQGFITGYIKGVIQHLEKLIRLSREMKNEESV